MKNEIIVGEWSRWQRQYKKPSAEPKKPKESKPRARYVKPAELVEFEKEYNEANARKFANIPPECRARYTFSDKDANSLTRAIIAHLTFHGYFAARVNSTGVYDQRRGTWRTSNARKGLADITAVINGRAVQLEIKAGKDRPRTEQLRVREEVQASGGVYEFVRNFPEYMNIYNLLTGGEPQQGVTNVTQ